MLISLLIFLLLSNAVTRRRDKSILFSRIVVKSLVLCAFLACRASYVTLLEKCILTLGGLFNTTMLTHMFGILTLFISSFLIISGVLFFLRLFIICYKLLSCLNNKSALLLSVCCLLVKVNKHF